MTDIVEIIARAICEEDGNDPDQNLWLVDASHPRWFYNRQRAEAVIAALKANGYAIVPVEINEAINDAINAAPCSNAEYYAAAIQAAQEE